MEPRPTGRPAGIKREMVLCSLPVGVREQIEELAASLDLPVSRFAGQLLVRGLASYPESAEAVSLRERVGDAKD